MDTYRYILRYYIDNDFDTQARIEELVSFCEYARIEEVMLFLTPEELSPGHPSDGEIDTFIELALRVKQRLAQVGAQISLNPWTTIYQVPRGRALRAGQDFRLMVGETGARSPLVACPLCETWQEWLCSRFARMAREIEPVAIWIEDDWRLHNHGEELGWGGCFCDEHLRLFSQRVGQVVSREQLLRALLQAGKPHPWRKVWFELSRDTILQPLEKLCDAIRHASTATAPALMCSTPDQHSAEGRNWQRIRQAVGSGGTFMLRPHMPPYTQGRSLRSTPVVLRQTLACLDAPAPQAPAIDTLIYPELENSPRNGVFAKSGRYTVWQLQEAALFGSHGITINHFDMMGNGLALDTAFGDHLRRAKDRLNALRRLNLDDRNAEGVHILFSTEVASHIELQADSTTVQDLVHPSGNWSETCAILGISQRLTTQVRPQSAPVFVCAQTLRAFSDAQIDCLLGGTLVLDAQSVCVLLERGFGADIGVASVVWRSLETTAYAYERIEEADASVYGVSHPRMSAQRCAGRILAMEAAAGAVCRSTVLNALHEPLLPGTLTFENSRGGRSIAFCYPLGEGQFYMGYFNVFRAKFLQCLLTESPQRWLWAMAANGIRCQRTRVAGGTLFALLNPTDDPQENVFFDIPADDPRGTWLHLQDNGEWQPLTPQIAPVAQGLRCTFAIAFGSLDAVFLLRKD